MRENDDVERPRSASDAKAPANGVLQRTDTGELDRCERADGDEQPRGEQLDLAIEVAAAARDLLLVGDAISATLHFFSGKAANHRGDVDALAELGLRNTELVRKPREKPSSGGVREGTSVDYFVRAGRLTDEHQSCSEHATGDRRADDVRTLATREQRRQVFGKLRFLR